MKLPNFRQIHLLHMPAYTVFEFNLKLRTLMQHAADFPQAELLQASLMLFASFQPLSLPALPVSCFFLHLVYPGDLLPTCGDVLHGPKKVEQLLSKTEEVCREGDVYCEMHEC